MISILPCVDRDFKLARIPRNSTSFLVTYRTSFLFHFGPFEVTFRPCSQKIQRKNIDANEIYDPIHDIARIILRGKVEKFLSRKSENKIMQSCTVSAENYNISFRYFAGYPCSLPLLFVIISEETKVCFNNVDTRKYREC